MGLFDLFKRKTKGDDVNTGSNQIEEFHNQERNDSVIPIEVRLKGKDPTCDGLYPHEILVLSYAPFYCKKDNEYPGFWWYRYGIKDVSSILQSLYRKGLIMLGGISDAIKWERVSLIKEELKKRDLKTTGKKDDLVSRLVDNVDESELSLCFTHRPYRLTDAGVILLKKYEWIPYIHSHSIEDLNIWNLTEMVQSSPYQRYRDTIWSFLNERGMEYAKDGMWGLYRNTRFHMSEFVAEEGKIDKALYLLCEVVYIDLSGLGNGFTVDSLRYIGDSFFPYEKSMSKIYPAIKDRITEYTEILKMDKEEIRNYFDLCG